MSTIDNINGIYAKDTELRSGISELRGDILSQTIKPLSITKNGTYTSDPTVGAYGYSPITVDVQEEPWQPLQDGYSNFWFELTNDTLSPWLNFSAKTENAVIDWGDGSGEVALDTLTPTHTYSKAGRYVVKVKGITGISAQISSDYSYMDVLTAVELNSEVTSIASNALRYQAGLEHIVFHNSATTLGNQSMQYCFALKDFDLPSDITGISVGCCSYLYTLRAVTIPQNVTSIGNYGFCYDYALQSITIPQNVASIGIYAFNACVMLSEIHVLPTNPPTLGTSVFSGLPTDFIIYVPVGYGDTYKSATGWSDYADHILEEGQTPNRAMVAKFNSDNTDNEEMR